MFRSSLICLLFIISFSVPAQNNHFNFEQLTVNEGLSHNSGLCLLQDQKGFLWIGTQNGLCRYDGYSIKKFLHVPGDSTSISGNYINSIFQDVSGTIWVGTNQGGINKFNPVNESFTSYKNDPGNPFSIGFGSIYYINEDRFGNLWVAVNPAGLFLFDKKNNKFYHFGENPNEPLGYSGKRAYCLFRDSDNILWIGTDKGLNKLIITQKQNVSDTTEIINRFNFSFVNWRNDPNNKSSLVNNGLVCIEEDFYNDQKTLWIGTDGGLSRMLLHKDGSTSFINYKKEYPEPYSIGNNLVWSVQKDSKGRLWIGTKTGLNLFDYNRGSFQKNIYSPQSGNSPNYTVRYILEDRSGVMWFGTENIGVLKLTQEEKNFHVYAHNPLDKKSLSDNIITAVLEDNGNNLWIGTKYGGVNKLSIMERAAGKFIHFIHDPFNDKSILDNHIRSIYQDKEGTIWIGSWNPSGGLNQYVTGSNSFTHFQHDISNPNSLSDNQVKNIAEDKEGNLWIALSETGIDMFDKKSKKFSHYTHIPDDPNSISDNSVMNIKPDDSNNLWISTFNGGLDKLDLKTKNFTHYQFDPDNDYSISSNRVWTVYIDSKKRFWVGTDNGINYFDPVTERFVSFDETDGLINKSVYGILEDEHNNLWLSTQNGISKMEILSFKDGLPDKVFFTNYDSEDNLAITEFNSNTSLKSKTGEMFFGSVDGLVHFYPDNIKNNKTVPTVVITSFKIFEKETDLDSSIVIKKRIELPYENNFFSFEYAALDFQFPDKNQYAYKLEGFNDNWVLSGNRRFVSFSHLDPGEYTFRVKASNNDGVWNEKGASVAIVITPPFWLTTWFRLLISAAVLVLLTFSLRYLFTREYKKKLRELEIQSKIKDERERISRELHDNIGANLTSIITGLEISKRFSQKDDWENLIENIGSLESHTRSTIDELRQTIWSLNNEVNKLDQLNEKIKEFILHIGKFGDKAKIQFKFTGNGDIPLSSSEALNLFRIIQESVNNAIKHSRCTEINVYVGTEEDSVNIKIQDNGTGFNQDQIESISTGVGLINLKKRAAAIGAEIKIDSVLDKGTIISVNLKNKK